MQQPEDDHYALLGIDQSANSDDVRKAYLRVSKRLNPELFTDDPEEKRAAEAQFSRMTLAHEILSDPQRRSEYDTRRQMMHSEQPSAVHDRKVQAQTTHEEEVSNLNGAKRHLEKAEQLFAEKKHRDAEIAIKEAIRLAPHEPEYHTRLAEIYLARGWRRLAIVEARASLDLDPDDPDAVALERRLTEMAETVASPAVPVDVDSSESKVKNGFFEQLKDLFSGKKR